MRNVQRYTVVMAAALLAACGGDDKNGTGPDGSGLGSFTATLSGDIAGPLAGVAGHASVSSGESQGFVIAFEDTPASGTVTASILIGRENPALPTTGAHAIMSGETADDPSDYVMLAVVTDALGGDWLCGSTGGTMNVSSSSASRIRGSINITALCLGEDGETEKAITLAGNFDSRQEQVPALRAMVAPQR